MCRHDSKKKYIQRFSHNLIIQLFQLFKKYEENITLGLHLSSWQAYETDFIQDWFEPLERNRENVFF